MRVVEVVRDIDDDRVRAEEQARLEAQGRLAVKQPLPPAVGHEGGDHDGDRPLRLLLLEGVDVSENRRHKGTVRRLDEVQRDLAGPAVPAFAELTGALLARRDVNRL